MLAAINPKIVAELDTLAASWMAVANELRAAPSPTRHRVRERKRKTVAKP